MTSEEKAKLLAGMFQGANLEHAQIIAVAESGSTIIYKKVEKEEEQPHFPLNSTKDDGVSLYNFLTENQYMKVPLDSWLFLMGFITEKPQKVVSITWLTTKEQLRTMLVKSFEGLITNNTLKKADLERLAPNCFVDINGKSLNLSKPKTEYSEKMDKLEKFFRPSSDE